MLSPEMHGFSSERFPFLLVPWEIEEENVFDRERKNYHGDFHW